MSERTVEVFSAVFKRCVCERPSSLSTVARFLVLLEERWRGTFME